MTATVENLPAKKRPAFTAGRSSSNQLRQANAALDISITDDARDKPIFELREVAGQVFIQEPDGKSYRAENGHHVGDGYKLVLTLNGSKVKICLGACVVCDKIGLGHLQFNGTWILCQDGASLRAVAVSIL